MDLLITEKETSLIVDNKSGYLLGTTPCALGNIISMLEEEFPANNYYDSEYLLDVIQKSLIDKVKPKTIWGISENGSILHTIYSFINEFNNEKEKMQFDMQDIEKFRITNNLTITCLPINICDLKQGMQFKSIKSIKEVIYGLLFYYAYNKYKLVKCEHCGRWFATYTLKNKYCSRNSTYNSYTHLNCEEAVRRILQEIKRERKRIYNSLTTYSTDSKTSKLYTFQNKCDEYKSFVKKRASIKNLSEYWDYLKNFRNEVV